MSGEAGRVSEQRREPLQPPIHGDVIDLNAALGQQFLDVAVRRAVAQVPAHRHRDDLGGKPEAAER
jgi:hypothetical protein